MYSLSGLGVALCGCVGVLTNLYECHGQESWLQNCLDSWLE